MAARRLRAPHESGDTPGSTNPRDVSRMRIPHEIRHISKV